MTNLSLELGCSVAVRYSHTMLGFWPAKFASNHACGLTYEVDWFMSPNAALYVTVRALQLLAESWYYNNGTQLYKDGGHRLTVNVQSSA